MQGITPRTSLWESPHKRLLSLLPIIHLFPVPSSIKRRKTKQFNHTTYPVLRLAESANVTQLQNVFSTTRTTWTTNQDVNKRNSGNQLCYLQRHAAPYFLVSIRPARVGTAEHRAHPLDIQPSVPNRDPEQALVQRQLAPNLCYDND